MLDWRPANHWITQKTFKQLDDDSPKMSGDHDDAKCSRGQVYI